MKRLDLAVAEKYSITRSLSSKYIKQGLVSVGGIQALSPDKNISSLDIPFISLLQDESLLEEELIASPENIPLDVVYEDENVLVVNKPSGMSVHPSKYESHGTLANALVFRFQELLGKFPELQFRPGIVHRLDKFTSGIIIVAKNAQAHAYLSAQFKDRLAKKEYLAIVSGIIPREKDITSPIMRSKRDGKQMVVGEGGRDAWTYIEPIQSYFKDSKSRYTFLKALPKTGRTHQIRVHLKSFGYPIVGDLVYHGEVNDHMFLHAHSLHISIPVYGEKLFQIDAPDYFDQFLSLLTAYNTVNEPKKLQKESKK